jgi:hypothetical protein
MPEALKRGRTSLDRITSLLAIAEPLLGINWRDGPGRNGIIRKQPGGWVFITADPDATLFASRTAPPGLRGKSRYDWVDAPGGGEIRLGYLREEFRGVTFAPFNPVAMGLHSPGGRRPR